MAGPFAITGNSDMENICNSTNSALIRQFYPISANRGEREDMSSVILKTIPVLALLLTFTGAIAPLAASERQRVIFPAFLPRDLPTVKVDGTGIACLIWTTPEHSRAGRQAF